MREESAQDITALGAKRHVFDGPNSTSLPGSGLVLPFEAAHTCQCVHSLDGNQISYRIISL